MGNSLGMLAAKEPDFQIHGLVKFQLFGQELWLTTTHVSILIVALLLLIFALVVRAKLSDAERPNPEPCRILPSLSLRCLTIW